jgi:hypothetical protein
MTTIRNLTLPDEDISELPTVPNLRAIMAGDFEPSDDSVDRHWSEELYRWHSLRELSMYGKHGGAL